MGFQINQSLIQAESTVHGLFTTRANRSVKFSFAPKAADEQLKPLLLRRVNA
jgi:hypothetical protein